MVAADNVKEKLQGLIAKANETTGNTDADLTAAVNALVDGFGQGGGGGLIDGIAECEVQTFTPEADTNEVLNFSLNMGGAPTGIIIAANFPSPWVRSFVEYAGGLVWEDSDDGTLYATGSCLYCAGASFATSATDAKFGSTNRCGAWNVTNKGFSFRGNYYGGQHTYFRAGYTYVIAAVRLVTQ